MRGVEAATRSSKTAAALVCDLDGVVRHFDTSAQAAVESRYGLPEGAIGRACFSSPLLTEATSGVVPDAEWREAAARDLPLLAGVTAADALREWTDLPVTLAADVLDLLAQVRERHPVVLLTNATDRLAADIDRLGIGQAFDEIINSSDVGAAKPDLAAFRAAATAVDRALGRTVTPEMIAFVDDSEGHVVAAQALGWRGHLFLDGWALRAFLHGCGLLT